MKCPNCSETVLLKQEGKNLCESCGKEFEISSGYFSTNIPIIKIYNYFYLGLLIAFPIAFYYFFALKNNIQAAKYFLLSLAMLLTYIEAVHTGILRVGWFTLYKHGQPGPYRAYRGVIFFALIFVFVAFLGNL